MKAVQDERIDMETRKMNKAILTALVAASAGALLSVIFLTTALPSSAGGEYTDVSNYRAHEAGLIIAESVISICFALFSALILVKEDSINLRNWACSLAVLRLIMGLWQYALHFKPGWYYIMDPVRSTRSSWILIALAIVQIAAFLQAGVKAGRKRA